MIITTIEYFAAHAPKKVPDWFEPKMPPIPEQLTFTYNKFGKDSGHPNEELFRKYYDGENDAWGEYKSIDDYTLVDTSVVPQSFRDEVSQWNEKVSKNRDEINAWHNQRSIEKITQWPWFWANNVLESRNKILQS